MTRTVNLLILILSLLTAHPGGLFAQEQWKSGRNDNGAAIYSRKIAGDAETVFNPGIAHHFDRGWIFQDLDVGIKFEPHQSEGD